MSKVVLKNIKPFIYLDPGKTYLVLIAIDKEPPHLGFITNGKYYSVSTNGVKNGVDAEMIIKSLNKKNVPTILLEIYYNFDNTFLVEYYNSLKPLQENQSCFIPIRHILSQKDVEFRHAQYVFELIPILIAKDALTSVYHINAEHLMKYMTFQLKEYTQEDINAAIKNVNQLC
jgi:hypothetical protein